MSETARKAAGYFVTAPSAGSLSVSALYKDTELSADKSPLRLRRMLQSYRRLIVVTLCTTTWQHRQATAGLHTSLAPSGSGELLHSVAHNIFSITNAIFPP